MARSDPMEKPTQAVWFHEPPATTDGNFDRLDDIMLTPDEVRLTWGPALVQEYLASESFRREYFRLSYTWHVRAFPSGVSGGAYGAQWCLLFERVPGMPRLHLGDFASLHNYLFFTLRRAMFDQTCYLADPNAEDPESFHMVPNDQGTDGHPPGALGVSVRSGP